MANKGNVSNPEDYPDSYPVTVGDHHLRSQVEELDALVMQATQMQPSDFLRMSVEDRLVHKLRYVRGLVVRYHGRADLEKQAQQAIDRGRSIIDLWHTQRREMTAQILKLNIAVTLIKGVHDHGTPKQPT